MPQYDAVNGLSGNHRLEGVIIASGNHVRPGTGTTSPSVLDVAPTVLYLLGLPTAEDMEGHLIRDAIELTRLPAVEVHISNIEGREPWRAHSVIRDVVIGHVQGKGVDGYREALAMLKEHLDR